jgi:flagellar motor switch protein FliM
LERILSKEEISELLSAVRQGEVESGEEAAPAEPRRQIRKLDLVQAPGLSRWKIPNLDLIIDAFGRNYAISLTNRLRRPVLANLTGIESIGFEAALAQVSPNSAIGILNLDPFKTAGLLIVDEALAYPLLEILLGGAADSRMGIPNRPLTAIEMNLLRALMEDSCPDLAKAFNALERLNPSLVKLENSLRLVNIVTPEAGVLMARFKLNLDRLSGSVWLMIPHASLEPLRERLRDSVLSVATQANEAWPGQLEESVRQVQTTLRVQVGEVGLNVRDILNFQVGDIIDLGCAPTAPLKVLVEDRPKFWAQAGVRNGNKAIRLSGKIERSQ